VIQEPLGCIKGLSYSLCIASLGKSGSLLPTFHIHLFFFLHPNPEKKNHYGHIYLIVITLIPLAKISFS